MNIKVKVKPSLSQCRMCLNIQQEYNQVESCKDCEAKREGVMINTYHNFLGAYATVTFKDGTLENVALERVKVIDNEV